MGGGDQVVCTHRKTDVYQGHNVPKKAGKATVGKHSRGQVIE